LKDIGNYKLLQVGEALQRLDRAVARLEAASANTAPDDSLKNQSAELERKLADLTRNHGDLKEAATRVASRLDMAISNLEKSLGDD
jgi:hypothetical protein